MVRRGVIVDFKGDQFATTGHLIVKREGKKLETIPCNNRSTIMQLHQAYGNIILDGTRANISRAKGRTILYDVDMYGNLITLVPIEQASDEYIQKYKEDRAKLGKVI